jgi:hypothetical protein
MRASQIYEIGVFVVLLYLSLTMIFQPKWKKFKKTGIASIDEKQWQKLRKMGLLLLICAVFFGLYRLMLFFYPQ